MKRERGRSCMLCLKLVPEPGWRRRVKALSQHHWEIHGIHTLTQFADHRHRRGQFALLSICLKPLCVCVRIFKHHFMKQKMYLLTCLTHQSAPLIAKHLASEMRVNSDRRVWIQISAAALLDKHVLHDCLKQQRIAPFTAVECSIKSTVHPKRTFSHHLLTRMSF